MDLKRLTRMLAEVVTESPVMIDADGIHFLAADPSMVTMVGLTLKPALFSRFNVNAEREFCFGINTEDLKARVGEARKGDELAVSVTRESGEYVLHVAIKDGGVNSTFSIDALDLDDEDVPTTDDLEFEGCTVVSVAKFGDAVKRMGDTVELALEEDRFTMASDLEGQRSAVEFRDGSDHLLGIKLADGPVRSRYSTRPLRGDYDAQTHRGTRPYSPRHRLPHQDGGRERPIRRGVHRGTAHRVRHGTASPSFLSSYLNRELDIRSYGMVFIARLTGYTWHGLPGGDDTVTAVDELLSSYGLTRDNAVAYINAIVRSNQSETAAEIGVSRPTINRYKNAFREMHEEERAFLIASLFDERWRELLREE